MKRSEKVRGDISRSQDLIMAVTNLISMEEHLAFTAMKTGENDYYEIARSVRKIRVQCLKDLIGEPRGELWCTSKHTLSAMMRLMEVASKEEGKKCETYLKAAFSLYELFWLFKSANGDKNGAKAEKSKGKNG